MSYCGPRGIPWSVFMGDRGQPGPGEPLWTDADRSLALEWQAERDMTCTGCGHPMDETTDPANRYGVQTLDCESCRTRAAYASEDQSSGVNVAGRRYVTVRRGRDG